MSGRESWKISFAQGDSFRDRTRAALHRQEAAALEDGQPCARGEWCAGRTVRVENGERTVTPASTYRAFCDGCQEHIGACLEEYPRLYRDLGAEIGEARRADVLVRAPFGPSVPLNEAIDAQMRAMTETLCSWELRVRDAGRLSDVPGENKPQDCLDDLVRSVAILRPRLSVLLSLAPEEMIRFLPPWAVPEEDQDAEIIAGDRWQVQVYLMLDGRRAGLEVMHLHYLARRLLLETSPPMPLLPDFRCRNCERKLLRKAAPPWHEGGTWYRSRCDGCGDEMTEDEYRQNALRWIAYERAHLERPVLAEITTAA